MRRQNVILTLWLAAPILTVVLLSYWIFTSFERGPVMSARAVGAGGNDTGGANAFGEWLAGRDPDEVQRIKRDLREGRLIDPYEWPGGIEVIVQAPHDWPLVFVFTDPIDPDAPAPVTSMIEKLETGVWRVLIGREAFLLNNSVSLGITRESAIPLVLELIPAESVPSDDDQPISFQIDLTDRGG